MVSRDGGKATLPPTSWFVSVEGADGCCRYIGLHPSGVARTSAYEMSPSFHRKIVDRDQLVAQVDLARSGGRTVAQCHGCFDILHPGHIRYLEFARRQADFLVVTLTGDPNVNKGDQRPYIPQELRAESLAALEFVDAVCIDPNPTAEDVLEDVKPDIYIKGREYEQSPDPRFLREREVVERNGGRVIFSSGDVVFSSTQLIDAMGGNQQLDQQRCRVIADRHEITRETLAATVDCFKGLRVLVIGDTILDRYVFCDAINVASEAPVMSLSQLDEQSYVGGAAIVARHIAAMGGRAFLLTSVANDSRSAMVEHVLRRERVESHLLRCRPNLVEKVRYLVDDSKLLKVEDAQHVPLDSLAERRAATVLEQQADAADAVIFCDFGFGMITGGLLGMAMDALRQRVRTISADVSGPRANLLHFRNADLLCPTERELRANLNDYDRGLSYVAHTLLAQTQSKHLFVTVQKKGLVMFDRPTQDPTSPDWSGRLLSEHLPTFADRPLDCLGGGDALLAAATLSLAAGAGLMHAAYLGNAAAALELSELGNVPISSGALHRWISQRTELAARKQPATADAASV